VTSPLPGEALLVYAGGDPADTVSLTFDEASWNTAQTWALPTTATLTAASQWTTKETSSTATRSWPSSPWH